MIDPDPEDPLSSRAFKALGDPIRLDMVRQIAAAGELSWSALEDALSVSKPTISYHLKTLVQAELIIARKRGRHLHYSLRQETLRDLVDGLWELSPQPRLLRGDQIDHSSAKQGRRSQAARERRVARPEVPASEQKAAVVFTW
ncbi:metalloregulator ArsR/SmtB family transcription factor [Nocardioides sp. WS12]|uniref:ArsR/SmtB family transcription factor n=1 Tax=Nocardioides sp. WS12 TaxID=2486272 RepID=UPI00191E95C3|nr:metalloregulator ArsR/SmtB family transcription factor [Nocardioides sp. WS12]